MVRPSYQSTATRVQLSSKRSGRSLSPAAPSSMPVPPVRVLLRLGCTPGFGRSLSSQTPPPLATYSGTSTTTLPVIRLGGAGPLPRVPRHNLTSPLETTRANYRSAHHGSRSAFTTTTRTNWSTPSKTSSSSRSPASLNAPPLLRLYLRKTRAQSFPSLSHLARDGAGSVHSNEPFLTSNSTRSGTSWSSLMGTNRYAFRQKLSFRQTYSSEQLTNSVPSPR